MKKLGILVGEKGNWSFFTDIFNHIKNEYQVDVFKEITYKTPLLYGRLNRWAYVQGIRKKLENNDACFFEWASELLTEATQMRKTCPIITRLHSYEVFFWAPRINWDRVDRVILVSNAMREKFCELYPSQAQKTRVVYNGVNLDKYNPDHPKVYHLDLGMLCSFNPRKGIYQIVLLIHKLKRLGFDPHLHIAGGRLHGPDFDEYYVSIMQLIEKLGLTANITIYGHVSNPGEWFNKIDIYISNSYWEGQQVSLLEALAAGCYSLSHCWKGAEEILPEDNIFVGDEELEEKVTAYHLKSDDHKRNIRKQMRQIAVEKFDIETTKEKILEKIKEVF